MLTLLLKIRGGQTKRLIVPESMTIDGLKNLISSKIEADDNINLSLQGKILKDGKKTLEYAGLFQMS